MKLLSTTIAGNSVEMTFADNPQVDDAAHLAVVRFQTEVDDTKPVAFWRYWALQKLQETLSEQIEADRRILNKQDR